MTLVASAKGYHDTQNALLKRLSANVVLLARVLANYGPEAKETRDLLRNAVFRTLDQLSSNSTSPSYWMRRPSAPKARTATYPRDK